jgi:uncharacterized protein
MWWKLLTIAALSYGVIVAAVYVTQTQLLFPTRAVSPAGPRPRSAERLGIVSASGHPLRGLHIPAAEPRRERLVVLGFGGNAWNADDAAVYLHDLYPAAEVVTFHYRGYAPSGGRAGTAAHLADAPLVYDFVRSRFGDIPIVAVGFSVGSGIAASLASRRPLAGAILVTPFDSLAAVASTHYPWLPVRLLLRHRLEVAADLREVRVPVAIIGGERDSLVPAARTEALRLAVPNVIFARTIGGAGHNDIYRSPLFREAMRDALARVLPSADGGAAR